MRFRSPRLDEHLLLGILLCASAAGTLQSGLLCHKDVYQPSFDGEAGQCTGWTLWSLICFSGSTVLSSAMLLAVQLWPTLLGGGLKLLQLTLLPWWLVGTSTMTFHAPYHLASNGYFTAWVALGCSWKLVAKTCDLAKAADEWLSSAWGVLWSASVLMVLQTIVIMHDDVNFGRVRLTDRYQLHEVVQDRRWTDFKEQAVNTALVLMGSFSVFMVFLGRFLVFTTGSCERFSVVAPFLLILNWTAGVAVATFDFPYPHPGNGFFACWVSWAASAALLPEGCRTAGARGLTKIGTSRALPTLIVSSSIVWLAAARVCYVYFCDSFTEWAVSCGAISSAVGLVAAVAAKDSAMLPVGVLLLFLWAAGAATMTLYRPFTMMGNGFAGSWVSLVASMQLVYVHAPSDSSIRHLDSSDILLAVVLLASVALVSQASVDCMRRERCEWNWIRAIMFGAISLPLTALVIACKHLARLRSLLRCVAVVLCLLWCAGVVAVTFSSPYTLMGTGYIGCWFALVASVQFLQAHWTPGLVHTTLQRMSPNETTKEGLPGNAPCTLAREYEGSFSHAALGPGSIDIKVEISSEDSGKWMWLGEAQDIVLACTPQSVRISDNDMVFHGVVGADGSIRGDVHRGTATGGHFSLVPRCSSDAFSNALNTSFFSTKSSINQVSVTQVEETATLAKVQELFDKTWQNRTYEGQHKVQKLKVERVERVSNTRVRKQYFDRLQEIQAQAEEKAILRESLLSYNVDTSLLALNLDTSVNEALMFHGSSPGSAMAILRSRVKVMSSGAAHGDLYGPGCYFADSVSKADTYAKPRSDGLCGIVISRVVLGNVYTTTEQSPDIKNLMRKINSGDFHSVCGDRRTINKSFGGWREFITFDENRSLPLLLAWYRRM